jgi:hypothetical protein
MAEKVFRKGFHLYIKASNAYRYHCRFKTIKMLKILCRKGLYPAGSRPDLSSADLSPLTATHTFMGR